MDKGQTDHNKDDQDKINTKYYNLALRYLARSPRTIKEIKRYLLKKNVQDKQIRMIIARLMELNYLDDMEFSRQFIENRIRFKPKSTFALGYELRQKGISSEIVDQLLMPLDNFKLACDAVKIKTSHWQHYDTLTRRKKFMNHLSYRGFDYGVCMDVWELFND